MWKDRVTEFRAELYGGKYKVMKHDHNAIMKTDAIYLELSGESCPVFDTKENADNWIAANIDKLI